LQEKESHLEIGDPGEVHGGRHEKEAPEEEPGVVVQSVQVRRSQRVVESSKARGEVGETSKV